MQQIEIEKKFTHSIDVENYEVLTDSGWANIENIHDTIPYEVYDLVTTTKRLLCADNHIVFNSFFQQIFVKNLQKGESIWVQDFSDGSLVLDTVVSNESMGHLEVMHDLELNASSDRRYFTDGILSHNTHCAKTLANYLFDHKDSFIRINMNEYNEKFSINKLIGAPAGYVGYEEKGQLTEKVKNNPYSVILLDEIEKAHPDVLNTLLQALDEGTINDNYGQSVDFKNCIIIMTSNIGTEKILTTQPLGFNFDNSRENQDVEKIVIGELEKFLRPEVINRIDEKVIFFPLSKENIISIVDLELERVANRFKNNGFISEFSKPLKEFLAKEGYNKKYGARPLKRVITKNVEDVYTQAVLKKEITSGNKIMFSYIDGVVKVSPIIESQKKPRKRK